MEDVEVVPARKYDLVVFGATGFTGKYVVEEVARSIGAEPGLAWAVAGRSMKKLQGVLREAGARTEVDLEELPILIADVTTPQSLLEMARQTKVVLNCVGPYRLYGDQVVRACIEGGASHLDVSGEPYFLDKVALLYNKKAKEAGVYVVGACGFDSVPADMGVVYTQQQFEGDLNSIEGYLSFKSGPKGDKGHAATWESAILGFANRNETAAQRMTLLGPNPLPKPEHKLMYRGVVHHSEAMGKWAVPFPGSDRSVVLRSQVARKEDARPVQFGAYLALPSLLATIVTLFVGGVFGLLALCGPGRWLLSTFPRFFSLGTFSADGPTREQVQGASFSYTFLGSGYGERVTESDQMHSGPPDKTLTTRVTGPAAGYITTPICLVQAAYTLLKEGDRLPEGGGVFTPASAFADTSLIERLDKSNVKFAVLAKPE